VGVGLRSLTRGAAAGPFWTLVAVRVGFWVGTAISLLWAPLHSSFPPFRAYSAHGDLLFGTFAQWDSGWFLHIADHGYDSEQSTAFFPLYTLLAHAVAEVTRSSLVAGVLVSLAAGGVGVVVLHRIARPLLGHAGADDTVLLMVLYPIAFVFTAAYSDGLFLALAAGSFLGAMQGRALTAGVLGGLACATRLVGLALLPALILLLWPRTPRDAVRLAPLLLLPAAIGAYALYLDHHLGDAWAFLHAQGVFWNRHTHAAGPLSGIWLGAKDGYQGAAELARHLPRGSGAPGGFAHRDQWATWNVIQFLLLVAAGWLTWIAWRRLGAAFGLYSLATLLIVLTSPADVVPLVSLPRFVIADFPLFLALAAFCQRRQRLRSVLLYSFAVIGAAAAVGFAHHVWIA
jgi:Mannosyltransferase (PIG-V)